MKKRLLLLSLLSLCSLFLSSCGESAKDVNSLTVLNYGKYFDPDALKQFEEETGIEVEYEEYESPEEMYTKYKAGSISYDVACTSDYMVEKLILEGEAQEISYEELENYTNIDPTYVDFSKSFDPESKYTIPYFYGTVGILYNTTMVAKKDTESWDILWDPKYKGSIIMENSVRDAFLVPLKKLGYSLNTTEEPKLREALELLIGQKPLLYGYFVDESGDEMVAGNAAMAVVYSGEAAYAKELSSDLAFSVPKEGSNMWIDSWFIPKSCKKKENAEKFLNFLCRRDIAAKNFDYVYYATPNKAVYDDLDEEIQEDRTIFPEVETLENCELYKSLDTESTSLYNYLWKELKSS